MEHLLNTLALHLSSVWASWCDMLANRTLTHTFLELVPLTCSLCEKLIITECWRGVCHLNMRITANLFNHRLLEGIRWDSNAKLWSESLNRPTSTPCFMKLTEIVECCSANFRVQQAWRGWGFFWRLHNLLSNNTTDLSFCQEKNPFKKLDHFYKREIIKA